MVTQFELDGFVVDVVRKNIKNVHLRVYPPPGRVQISAPTRMSLDAIRLFAASRLRWIRKQQEKQIHQERDPAREYTDGERHYVWGQRFLLQVFKENAAPSVQMRDDTLLLRIRPNANVVTRKAAVESWYRQLVKDEVPPLIAAWEARLGVTARGFFVQRMKTRWGSCNPRAGTIRLNTALASKPRECLEYVVVHEMVHLLEASHGPRFVALMDRFTPNWRDERDRLNRFSARHKP